ncbi:hypothetical protein B0H16DRAFT_1525853 [Mycena metata]|uniref:Uncharacterized protein n=1 Tax=Mycena metata TaxID=1033252 RepID=A0AAD7JHB0_9AGAR|nr:hypothetical protein B0H16DRAFT_1525853 [Mycena metata]
MFDAAIPELVCEIAFHLPDARDLSSLSQCNHFVNEAVAPLLFKDIQVSEKSLPALAKRLLDYPEFAVQCKSLVVRSRQLGTDRQIVQLHPLGNNPDSTPSPRILASSMSFIVGQISQHRRLEKFSWHSYGTPGDGMGLMFDAEFWRSLAGVGDHLQEFSMRSLYGNSLAMLPSNIGFQNLRILRLTLGDHTTCSHFQELLNGLHLLEHLDFDARPWGERTLGGITFASSHPRLNSLSMELSDLQLPQDLDFLHRHPTIRALHLEVNQSFHCDDTSLPNLKALSLHEGTIRKLPALVSLSAHRTITHLRLIDMPSSLASLNFVQGMAVSLTCLELELGIIGNGILDRFPYWLPEMSELFKLLPNLREFGMMGRPFESDKVESFSSKHLLDFLAILDELSHLEAIRFYDICKYGAELPGSLLQNLGKVPSSLRYIKWEVHPDPKTYYIERRDEVTIGTAMPRPPVEKNMLDWTSDSVLNHMYT